VMGHVHTPDHVGLQLRDAQGQPLELRARYVVGCDGARSIVRSWLGDEHEDLGEHQAWLVVDAVLHHPLPLPEHTVQHCDPERPATSIYVHPLRRRWEIMMLPGDDATRITQPQNVWPLLQRWLQPSQGTLERAATYVFHSLVARHWQRGRLLIAGDAAHQTPPFLGQGLCAGVRDAMNLGWKLARALRHPAVAGRLLESYQSERVPHAREFVALAVDVGRVVQVTDPQAAVERDAKLKAQGLQFSFPSPRLGTGCYRDVHAASGKIFMQPLLPSGEWLDDVAAGRCSVLLGERIRDNRAVDALATTDFLVVREPGSAVARWLDEHDADALVVRPDGYIFDVWRRDESPDARCAQARAWLAPTR